MKRLFAFPGFEIQKNATITAPDAVFPFPRVEFTGPRGFRVRVHVQEGGLVALVGVAWEGAADWTYAGTLTPEAGFKAQKSFNPRYAMALAGLFASFLTGTAQPANLRFLAANSKDEKPSAPAKAELKIQPPKRAGEAPPAPVAAVSKTLAIAGR